MATCSPQVGYLARHNPPARITQQRGSITTEQLVLVGIIALGAIGGFDRLAKAVDGKARQEGQAILALTPLGGAEHQALDLDLASSSSLPGSSNLSFALQSSHRQEATSPPKPTDEGRSAGESGTAANTQAAKHVADEILSAQKDGEGNLAGILLRSTEGKDADFRAEVIAEISARSPEALAELLRGAGGDWNAQWPALSELDRRQIADALSRAYGAGKIDLKGLTQVEVSGIDGVNIIADFLAKNDASVSLRADYAKAVLQEALRPGVPPNYASNYAAAGLRAIGSDASIAEQVFGALASGPTTNNRLVEVMKLADQAPAVRLDQSNYLPPGRDLTTSYPYVPKPEDMQQVADGIASRHAAMKSEGIAFDDTNVYGSKTAIETVLYPPNRAVIRELATRYDVDPALLAGAIAAEMDFDHSAKDKLQDGIGRSLPGWFPVSPGQGAGIASVHYNQLEHSISYLKENKLPGWEQAQQVDPDAPNARSTFNGSAEAAAIHLAKLSHIKTQNGGSVESAQDMAVVWGAYRGGIGDVAPDPKPTDVFKTSQDFAQNHAGNIDASHPVEFKIGADAYQSEPYFELFKREMDQ